MIDQQNLYTLAEASNITGLSVEALRLRIKRGKLTAEKGNDGHPRVRLTAADLAEFRQQKPTLNQQESTIPNNVKALEEAVGILREQLAHERAVLGSQVATLQEALTRERERADRAEAAAAVMPELRQQLGRVEGEAGALRDAVAREIRQSEQAEEARKAAETQLDAAQAARDATQAELAAWMAGGPLARAWRGFWRR